MNEWFTIRRHSSRGLEMNWYPLMSRENMWTRQLLTCPPQAVSISFNDPMIIVLVLANDDTTKASLTRSRFPDKKLDACTFLRFRSSGPILFLMCQMHSSLRIITSSYGYDALIGRNPVNVRMGDNKPPHKFRNVICREKIRIVLRTTKY